MFSINVTLSGYNPPPASPKAWCKKLGWAHATYIHE